MARTMPKRRQDPPTKTTGSRGWPLGLNQLTHPSVIKNGELAECFNAVFDQNGVLKKRPGTVKVSNARTGDTTVNALEAVYDVAGDRTIIRIGSSGVAQKYNETTGTFADIAGSPDFSVGRTRIRQAYGYVYFFNANLPLSKWDGTSWTVFNALANPDAAPTTAKTGSGTGARTYYYKYVWFNEVGYTLASPASTALASMPDTLDDTTFITVTTPAAPAGTKEIGIYRGLEPGQERYLDKIPATDTIYVDKGQSFVDETYSVPSSNTTSGFKFKIAEIFEDSIIGVTEDMGGDTLVFSAGLEQFDNFGVSAGGGFYTWRRGEGGSIVAIKPFKEALYVFKTDKIGVFDFAADVGAATLKDLNLALGAVSQESIHAAGNDLRGWSEDGAFSLGNEPNFADVVRTKILSARVERVNESIIAQDFSDIVSIYHKNLSMWALPTASAGQGNNIIVVYDERYVAWSIWTGIKARCFTKYKNNAKETELLYGETDTGNMVRMFTGLNDQGNPINFRISTKQYDAGQPHKYKTFETLYLIFGTITGGSTRVTLVENGAISRKTYPIFATKAQQGLGVDEWGTIQFGEGSSVEIEEAQSLSVKYADLGSRDLFSLQIQLVNSGLDEQIEFMGALFDYTESEQPLPSTKRLQAL